MTLISTTEEFETLLIYYKWWFWTPTHVMGFAFFGLAPDIIICFLIWNLDDMEILKLFWNALAYIYSIEEGSKPN